MTIDAAVQSTTEVYEGSQRRRDNRQLAEAEEVPDFRVRSWPEPPAPEAFHGLAGDVVRVLDPHTEADPVALLSNFLVFFGSVIGRTAHFIAEADRHYTNLFAVQVGLSSKGRKGTAHGRVKEIFLDVDLPRNQSGLSSGEGLIWHVRDPIEKIEPVKERKEIIRYEPVIVDHGVEDKRLLCIETEFASVLRVLARDGNTLSAVIRNAWDTGDLQSLTKNSPGVATAAHISIIGHITRDELLRYLDSTEAGNGFGNRFLWVCVKRSKCLPEGGNLQQCDLQPIGERLREICQFARSVGEMKRDEEARQLWREVYPDLSEGKPGLLGAMIARAEAQVMRLACVYALLDCSELIRLEHLKAALAVWRYCENSARYIFGDSLGDPVADELLKALRSANEGMTRTEISKHFGRHKSAQEIGRALVTLHERGLVRREREEPAEGRPTERWHATRTQMSTHSSGEISEICEESPGDSGVTSLNSHISQPDTVVQSGVENDNGSLPNARQDTPHWSEENYEDI
ncbi:MAG: DUF3987 domain-containing protein [Armatimonadetes bacterium]|nr:DUF3987 domain-containing protein [Armatimonadota bacterium]